MTLNPGHPLASFLSAPWQLPGLDPLAKWLQVKLF